jgi:hypothetical protein
MKDHLIFDATDANTIIDSDSVGAYVRASDGTLITHTDVGGKKALDVYIAEGINVEVDLSHVDDSVSLGDGTTLYTGTTVNTDHGLDVFILNPSLTIDDGGLSITVDATDLDIRDLTAASDSVASWTHDGTGTAITSTSVNGDQALDVNISNDVVVNDAALANTAIIAASKSLATAGTDEAVVASALTDRKYLFIYNNDNRKIFIGQAGVDSTTGFPVSPGSYLELRAGAAVAVNFDSNKNGHNIRTLELS